MRQLPPTHRTPRTRSTAARAVVTGVLLAAAGGGLVACGDDGDAAEAATTTEVGEAPAVLSYEDVAEDFDAAVDRGLEEGREVVRQLVGGEAAAVHARLTPELQQQVPLAEAEAMVASFLAAAPLGDLVAERFLPAAPGLGTYAADHEWGDDRASFVVASTPAGLTVSFAAAEPPAAVDDAAEEVELRLPFDGLWWAGVAPEPLVGNHHAAVADQRHAYDFVVWRDGGTFRGAGTENADYWAWGQEVLAPAGATVHAVVDGLDDNRPQVESHPEAPAGNHVVLDLGDGSYALLAHFQRGTIRVAPGEQVEEGDVLGLTGNSGNSSEPHVHLHVQDQPAIAPGGGPVGRPISFAEHLADGQPQTGPVRGGQFVAAAGERG